MLETTEDFLPSTHGHPINIDLSLPEEPANLTQGQSVKLGPSVNIHSEIPDALVEGEPPNLNPSPQKDRAMSNPLTQEEPPDLNPSLQKDRAMSNPLTQEELYDMEYSDKISSVALETLHTKKARKPAILPVTNDIVEFQKYVREKIPQITKQVKLTQDSGLFKDLAQMTLSSLIVFNKRRSGETSKMLLSDLKENKKGNEDIAAMLSDVEQTLCKR